MTTLTFSESDTYSIYQDGVQVDTAIDQPTAVEKIAALRALNPTATIYYIRTETVTVSPTDVAPIASNGTLNINENTTGSGVLSAVGQTALTYAIVTQPTNGPLTLTGANYTYVPNNNFSGSDSFTFQATDTMGITSNVATVAITVTAVVTNTVVVTVIDSSNVTWKATATVGTDWTVAGQYLPLVNSSGSPHPGLRAKFYSDCVDVGAVPGANENDYSGTLTVTYNGTNVFGPQAVQFYRFCFNKTLRYGPQATWNPVDMTLFPNWAKGTFPLWNISSYDLSYNGMGVATYKAMGSTGSRGDIAYVPEWDVAFCVNPSDASFAIVRAAADNAGAWPIYALNDATGLPYDITAFPNTSFLPPAEEQYTGNPIAPYQGNLKTWKTSGSPLGADEAHETGYCFVAAAATNSARDKDHAAVWANYVLTAYNPTYRQADGIWQHYQERGSGWALRSIFLGAYVSSMQSYFANQLNIMLQKVPPLNSFGFLADYLRPGFNGPNSAIAFWEENYVRVVENVIAKKVPAWQAHNAYLAQAVVIALTGNTYPLSTIYVHTVKDSSGNFLPNWQTMLCDSLQSTECGSWTLADAQAATAPGVTLQEVYNLMVAHGFTGKLGDLAQYDTAPDDYPALMRASVAAAVDAGVPGAAAAWALMLSLPTQPVWGNEWAFNIVPVA